MKRFIFLIILLISGKIQFAQDCPGTITKSLSDGVHRWYWDGQLNYIQIKRTLGGQNLDNATASDLIRSAISSAAYAWASATQGAIQRYTNSDY